MQVDPAGTTPVAPGADVATARALSWRGHGEHDEMLWVQGRDGRCWQLGADRVHVEAAGAAAIAHALDGRVAQVADALHVGEHVRVELERQRVLAVEGGERGRWARRADLVQVEVAGVAAVAGTRSDAAAAVAAKWRGRPVIEAEASHGDGYRCDVEDLLRHYACVSWEWDEKLRQLRELYIL